MGLVDTHETIGKLEHIISEGDDDELGILSSLLDIVGNDGYVFEVLGEKKN